MKLTKTQRLFIAIGHVDIKLRVLHALLRTEEHERFLENVRQKMKQLRTRRKRLIREALEAARSENTEHYMNGINEVLRQIRR